jgi:uncharacterized protein YndB with AHSA1/START domain
MPSLHFERVIDLPPPMVWEALVDSDLLSGWLADASVDARAGGSAVFRWFDGAPSTRSSIAAYVLHETLTFATDNAGRWAFALQAVPGGPRNNTTHLRLTVTPATARQSEAAEHAWPSSLRNLELLLHGHPVDPAAIREQDTDPDQAAPPAAARDK